MAWPRCSQRPPALLQRHMGAATKVHRRGYHDTAPLLQVVTRAATLRWWGCYNGMPAMLTAATSVATTPHRSRYQSTPTWLPRHDAVAASDRRGCFTSWWSCYNGTTGCSGRPLALPQHHIEAATMARCHCCKQPPGLCYHGLSAAAASPTVAASATPCRAGLSNDDRGRWRSDGGVHGWRGGGVVR
jgi:hypothetical protein